jgi:S-phase kinase-associated protein 1
MVVTLETSDGKQYKLQENVICQSHLIKNMLDDLEITHDIIPLPNITSSIMDIIVRYGEIHKDGTEDSAEKDEELINVSHQVLFEIVLAANYLDLPGLLSLGCNRIAEMLKTMSIDQVQQDWNVPQENWYTPQERILIDQELKWANGS